MRLPADVGDAVLTGAAEVAVRAMVVGAAMVIVGACVVVVGGGAAVVGACVVFAGGAAAVAGASVVVAGGAAVVGPCVGVVGGNVVTGATGMTETFSSPGILLAGEQVQPDQRQASWLRRNLPGVIVRGLGKHAPALLTPGPYTSPF